MTAAKLASVPDDQPDPHEPKKKKNLAVTPQEAEAVDGYVTVEQCGVTLQIPGYGKITLAAMDAFRAGDNYEGTKQMVGEEQWKLLTEAGATMDDLNDLGKKIKEVTGN
jgi:hypothetical protein